MVIGLRRVNLVANVGSVIGFMASPSGALHHLYEKLLPLRSLGNINLLGDMSLTSGSLDFNGSLDTDCGNLDLDCGIYKRGKNSPLSIDGSVNTSSFNPSQLLPGLAPLTRISFETMIDLVIGKKVISKEVWSWLSRRWNGMVLFFLTFLLKLDFLATKWTGRCALPLRP